MTTDAILEWATEPRTFEVLDGLAAGALLLLSGVLLHLLGF